MFVPADLIYRERVCALELRVGELVYSVKDSMFVGIEENFGDGSLGLSPRTRHGEIDPRFVKTWSGDYSYAEFIRVGKVRNFDE